MSTPTKTSTTPKSRTKPQEPTEARRGEPENESEPMTEPEGGEGNYEAARRYREGVEKSVREGRSEELAEAAKRAIEGAERNELGRAEERGRRADTRRS